MALNLTAALALAAACGVHEAPPGVATPAVSLTQTATIESVRDTVDLMSNSRPRLDSKGWIIVAPVLTTGGARVAVFDDSGRLVQTFGRQGRGPGELQSIGAIGVIAGDSIAIHDPMTNTVTVYSTTPSSQFARMIRLPWAFGVEFGAASILVRGYFSRQPGSAGGTITPTREYSWSGEVIGTYGPAIRTEQPEREFALVVPAGRALMWRAPVGRYEFELRTPDTVIRRIKRDVPWFPDTIRPTTAPAWIEKPLPKLIAAVVHDSVLWVLIRRAAPNWQPVGSGPVAVTARGVTPPEDLRIEDLFEMVIEGLHVDTGRLLGSITLGGGIRGFAGPGVVWESLEDGDGRVRLRLFRLELN